MYLTHSNLKSMATPQQNTKLEQTMFCALEVEMSRLKWSIRVCDRNTISQNIDSLMCLCSKLSELNDKNIKKESRSMIAGREYLIN